MDTKDKAEAGLVAELVVIEEDGHDSDHGANCVANLDMWFSLITTDLMRIFLTNCINANVLSNMFHTKALNQDVVETFNKATPLTIQVQLHSPLY
ncbi:hypothetical protein J1N35_036625 [Gossypium stocksii]|uniref:Uncharacterized protein n=1 Tax=Gossypium stocksii TaxID=47602 RepID=A0A9D3ZK48_9ROSI|nr:hypothetical protein J1N35_036625 [Gossypium stocksii]